MTAVVSIVTLIYGLLTNSLPGIEHTEVDAVLVRRLRSWIFCCFPNCQGSSDPETQARRARRRQSFEWLLPALADQQMVLSLAHIVAVFSQWHEISVFSLWMVAWPIAGAWLCTLLAILRCCPRCVFSAINGLSARTPMSS